MDVSERTRCTAVMAALNKPERVSTETGNVLTQREDVLHLREDLTLAHDDGIEAAGHLEEVGGGVLVAEEEEVLAEILEGDPRVAAHPLLNLADAAVPGEGDDVDLHAVAGGQDASLLDVGVGAELSNRLLPLSSGTAIFSRLHGAGVDAEADGHDGGLGLGRVAWWVERIRCGEGGNGEPGVRGSRSGRAGGPTGGGDPRAEGKKYFVTPAPDTRNIFGFRSTRPGETLGTARNTRRERHQAEPGVASRPISSRGVAVARGRAETKDTGIAINSREAPPMLRNCSSAFELSTAAADTGRRVVSGRALSCVWGGVTTARVTGATLRCSRARVATTGFPPVAIRLCRIQPPLICSQRITAFAAGAQEAAISRMPKYACVYRRCVASRTALS